MPTISQPIKELLERHLSYLEKKTLKDEAPKIQVDEVASQIAAFYEKVRNLIDYHEGHLLRKNVIDRALRRRVFLKDISGREIAEPLVKEVIRSGRLGNVSIPESKVEEIQQIIDVPDRIIDHLETGQEKDSDELREWLLSITVCAIEESLVPREKEMMLADTMFRVLAQNLTVQGGTLLTQDTNILLFAAVQKSLLKVDSDQLHYRLFRFLYPNWSPQDREIAAFIREVAEIRKTLIYYTKHPLLPVFLRLCNRYDIVFHVLGDLVFSARDFNNLESEVETVYRERYVREKGRLFRLAFFSVVSFFLSKILVALAIEIPIDLYLLHHFSMSHAIANIVFPPLLMFLVVLSIRLPGGRNLALVTEEIKAVVFEEHKKNYTVYIPKKKNWLIQLIVKSVYLFVFAASLYAIVKVLLKLGFGAPSIVVFILFTSLVTATGLKIYNRAKEMSLEKRRARFFGFVLDLFTVPLAAIGRWAIAGLRRFNILVIITNFVIDLPLQLFVELVEHFNEFLRSKKEEIE